MLGSWVTVAQTWKNHDDFHPEFTKGQQKQQLVTPTTWFSVASLENKWSLEFLTLPLRKTPWEQK
jgi:hypothetical protein